MTADRLQAKQRSQSPTCVGVCGFPRSGSSMTMRMLEAGGIAPVEGSSPGSYELRGGLEGFRWVDPAALDGRAVKLLDYGAWFGELPAAQWRFIWLDRDPTEQARSHVKFMGAVGGVELPPAAVAKLANSFRADRPKLLRWYRSRGELLVTSFEAILGDPGREAVRLAAFVPGLDEFLAAAVPTERSPKCAPDLAFELSEVSDGR